MIAVENTLVSDDVLKEAFVCDLTKCKGECCIAGDSGAPLEEKELNILEEIYGEVKPFLSQKGVAALDQQGRYVKDEEGEYTTPLIDGGECAYTIFENGIAACGIEKAYRAGKISFRKPVSCHLYPIRVTAYDGFEAVNYHRWEICSDACSLGKSLKVPVYSFLKEPIIRKYGEEYFLQLQEAAALLEKQKKK
jgi:hypothetical protein